MGARDLDEVGGADAADLGVGRVDLGEGLGDVLAETRGAAGPGHRVPMVADASGVEGERVSRRALGGGRLGDGDHPALAVGGEEAAVGEEAGRAADRPLRGRHGVVVGAGESGDVEVAALGGGERRKRDVLAEDLGRSLVGEGLRVAEAAADFGERPPVGLRRARSGEKRALAGDAALGVGDGPGLLAPAEGGEQDVGMAGGVGRREHVGDDDERDLRDGGRHRVGLGHRDDRVGGEDPEDVDAACVAGPEEVDGLEAGLVG